MPTTPHTVRRDRTRAVTYAVRLRAIRTLWSHDAISTDQCDALLRLTYAAIAKRGAGFLARVEAILASEG